MSNLPMMHFVAAALPDAPSNLQVFARSPVSIFVSWNSPASASAVVLGYSVYYYDIGSAETMEAELNVTTKTCTLVGLRKFHQYSIRVAAFNVNGIGASTQEAYCRTLSDGQYLSVASVTSWHAACLPELLDPYVTSYPYIAVILLCKFACSLHSVLEHANWHSVLEPKVARWCNE